MSNTPQNLLDLEPRELRDTLDAFFVEHDQPSYRTEQVARWLYESDVLGFGSMTDLSKDLRAALAERFVIAEPEPDRVSRSRDGTTKHLWKLDDGELVESVLIPSSDRLTLCLSSQAGCAVGCTFCATGWSGFSRQLRAGEIVAQFRASRRYAAENGMGPITNIVYMGMGEPLANRDAVLTSLTTLNHGFDVGARRITVSTVGVVPGILELAERPEQFGLALSLHAPDSELRRELVPLEKRWPLDEVIAALERFGERGGRRVTFEYTLIEGVNDDAKRAAGVATLARRLGAFVNLIPFNPIPYTDWKPSAPEVIERFRSILDAAGVSAAVREPRGRDIDAACGQLKANALVELEGARPTGA